MIQRIQTVYLALVALLCLLGLCLPLAQYFNGADLVASFNNFRFIEESKGAVADWGTCGLGVLLVIVTFITFVAIMLFHYRMRQLRLVIFSTILLAGYMAYYAVLAWKFQMMTEAEYHLSAAAIFPILSIILNCMAIHGIRKDEALVRSLDRLR